jgi:hypothetical protein
MGTLTTLVLLLLVAACSLWLDWDNAVKRRQLWRAERGQDDPR